MNWASLDGNWGQFKDWLRLKWTRFSDADIEYIHGSRDKLIVRLREKYGLSQTEAEWEWFRGALSREKETPVY
jgi:hypothetical protein